MPENPRPANRPASTPAPAHRPAPATPPASNAPADDRRLDLLDRRSGLDRREVAALQAAIGSLPQTDEDVSGLERRRGPGRRRSDFLRSAEEGQLNREQFLFLMAIEEFKRANDRTFPSWTDVLEVIRLLGYRKTMPSELRLASAEDWKEAPTTPSNVRPSRWTERFRAKPATPPATPPSTAAA